MEKKENFCFYNKSQFSTTTYEKIVFGDSNHSENEFSSDEKSHSSIMMKVSDNLYKDYQLYNIPH